MDKHLPFLSGINSKEEQAWSQLYDYFYAPLCCYATRLIGNNEGSEDIVQHTLVQLYHSKNCFFEMKVLTAYLYRAVYHASLNFVRDKQRAHEIHEKYTESIRLTEEEAKEMALEEEAISRFYAVLFQLPAQQQQIMLQSLQGKTVKEIAELLQLSENSVKTQKKRAYQSIREQMGHLWFIIVPIFFP